MIEINMDEVKTKLDAGVPLARLAREIGISRQTLYSRLKEM
ncbi:helix-turn-helix domain-containing protein [Alphaproteobacteria bacterium]|nr:helix-turn-helix domain-containing protein [Alphaproteobacteria bacterium]